MNQDYNFSSKVKIFSLSLVVIGLIGIAYGFYSAPSSVEEAKEIVANMSHGSDHGGESDHGSDHLIMEENLITDLIMEENLITDLIIKKLH